MKSLDPRVVRLPTTGVPGDVHPKESLDQHTTFEVFVQPREGKPFQHEGIVHAPNLELAYVLAKEAFTRRFTCCSLCVVGTDQVFTSPTTDGNVSAYDLIDAAPSTGQREPFEIYHLLRRGKQHVHAGTVEARGPEEAMAVAKEQFGVKPVFNVWAIRTSDIRFTRGEDMDLWSTLPEKKFRDASDYKGGDKLKSFLEKHGQTP